MFLLGLSLDYFIRVTDVCRYSIGFDKARFTYRNCSVCLSILNRYNAVLGIRVMGVGSRPPRSLKRAI